MPVRFSLNAIFEIQFKKVDPAESLNFVNCTPAYLINSRRMTDVVSEQFRSYTK